MVGLREQGVYAPDDPMFSIGQAFYRGAFRDPDLLRGFIDVGTMLAMPDEVLGRPGIFDKVLGYADSEAPFAVPSRDELMALVSS